MSSGGIEDKMAERYNSGTFYFNLGGVIPYCAQCDVILLFPGKKQCSKSAASHALVNINSQTDVTLNKVSFSCGITHYTGGHIHR